MITTEIPTWEDPPAMPKSNYRASGLVLRPKADGHFSRNRQLLRGQSQSFRRGLVVWRV